MAAFELFEHRLDAVERIAQHRAKREAFVGHREAAWQRLNSAVPSRSSSVLTCWLTAAWVTFNSSAARVKLKCRAEDSNARNAFRGRCGLMVEA